MKPTDELRNIYKDAGALSRFFDVATPLALFRGRAKGSHVALMQPTLIGWNSAKGPRPPDVLLDGEGGGSPQYSGTEPRSLVVEGKDNALTADILRNADKFIVKGCRTMRGDHRGVSVFDKKNMGLRNFDWYKIVAEAKIPPALAVTRDAVESSCANPIHYTIAPKDDMSLALFLQYLKSFESLATLD